jgi:hypothetical protein
MFLLNEMNVLVGIANKTGFKKKIHNVQIVLKTYPEAEV